MTDEIIGYVNEDGLGDGNWSSPLVTAREVAHYLHLNVNTVKRLGDRGELPFYRIGKRGDRRYRPSDVAVYLVSRRG